MSLPVAAFLMQKCRICALFYAYCEPWD